MDHRDAQEWGQALDILVELQAHNFEAPINLEWLIDDTKKAKDKATRRQRQDRAYRAVARTMANQSPDVAQQTWDDFLRQYPEFDPLTDSPSDYLRPPHVEQKRLLEVMVNHALPPTRRAEAGRELATIGDPRKAVMSVDGMQFCFIPKGRFWIGSDDSDDLAYDWEKPAAWYDVPYDYWMARFPVTNAQFQAFVDENGYKNERWWGVARSAGYWSVAGFKGRRDNKPRLAPMKYDAPFPLPNHPVVGVSWYEGIAFTEWLTVRWRDKGYLSAQMRVVVPSEPEWEKAARGGEQVPTSYAMGYAYERFVTHTLVMLANPLLKRRYPYGDTVDATKSNYEATGIEATNAVGIFGNGASPYGCEEMSGTVWEWNRSVWSDTYPYTISSENLTLHNKERVVRGGAFNSNERFVRCAYRSGNYPDGRYSYFLGLRVAVVGVSP